MINVLHRIHMTTHEYNRIEVTKGCEALMLMGKLHVKTYYIFILLCTHKIHNLVHLKTTTGQQ